jgi:hypothetical protein
MGGMQIIGVYPSRRKEIFEQVLKGDPWRRELYELLLEYVRLALVPSAYGIRQVVDVLQELRDLMLLDGVDHTLVGVAMERIKSWIAFVEKGEEFDLASSLRALREFAEEVSEGWSDGDCEGLLS